MGVWIEVAMGLKWAKSCGYVTGWIRERGWERKGTREREMKERRKRRKMNKKKNRE